MFERNTDNLNRKKTFRVILLEEQKHLKISYWIYETELNS